MRYGIFGDIHGNLEAFEAVLKALDKERCDTLVCVGDVVGYGADPHECIERVRELGVICIAGNHDLAAIGRFDVEVFNAAARDAIVYTISKLTSADVEFLSSLPLTMAFDDMTLAHASPLNPANFDYIFTIEQAETAFEVIESGLAFIGHSHVPVIFYQDPGTTDFVYENEFYLRRRRKIIFNVGSVGQPRDGDPAPSYAVFDDNVAKLRLARVGYDIDAAAKKILNAGLPPVLAERLYQGY